MNTKRRFVFTTAAIATVLLSAPFYVSAQTTLFFDDFNGPALNPEFQASLPTIAGTPPVTYLGAPNYSFQTLGGATVLRLTNTLNNLQRLGWSTSDSFKVTDFRYELRFNVLVQSPTTSIDHFVEAWLIDSSDPSRYLLGFPDGSNFGVDRRFHARSSIDSLNQFQAFNYLDNTWYRLVLTGAANQNIRASLFADDGTTELIGQTFGFNTAAFPAGFRVGIAQALGVPNAPYPVDVAIDWVRLTGTAVPEPLSLVMAGCALAVVTLAALRGCHRMAVERLADRRLDRNREPFISTNQRPMKSIT